MKKGVLALSLALVLSLAACQSTNERVEYSTVYINDGSVQCEGGGKTAVETEKELIDNGISVSETQCGHLAMQAMITMCGGPTATINVHIIATEDLKKAQSLGFKDVLTLKKDENKGYEVTDCNVK
jgi:hypothetical protein